MRHERLRTQREALWVSLAEMETIEGMSHTDSQQLVEELMTPGMAHEYVYAHKYRPGDMVVWDNRCMFHRTPRHTISPDNADCSIGLLSTTTRSLPESNGPSSMRVAA